MNQTICWSICVLFTKKNQFIRIIPLGIILDWLCCMLFIHIKELTDKIKSFRSWSALVLLLLSLAYIVHYLNDACYAERFKLASISVKMLSGSEAAHQVLEQLMSLQYIKNSKEHSVLYKNISIFQHKFQGKVKNYLAQQRKEGLNRAPK